MRQDIASGRAESEATATSEQETFSEVQNFVRAHTEGTSYSRSAMQGATHSAGESEAFEPVYEDLPTSFHSKENVPWMQGDLLRSLPPGAAIVSFVDGARRESTLLRVPLVTAPALSDADFAALRMSVLEKAPSAHVADVARRLLEGRERAILARAASALEPTPEPESFGEPARKPRKPKK